jgi:hypothetical protein
MSTINWSAYSILDERLTNAKALFAYMEFKKIDEPNEAIDSLRTDQDGTEQFARNIRLIRVGSKGTYMS